MTGCDFGFHAWQYLTRKVVYTKNGNIINEREEVYKRRCARCKRTERNVGKYGAWVRVEDETEPEKGKE